MSSLIQLSRKYIRLFFLFLIIVYGIVFTFLFLNKSQSTGKISFLTTNWFRACSNILGIKIHVVGTPLTQKTLFVANHLSWIDIPCIGQLVATHFLSKSEVKQWPVIGWLATKSGTLYLSRGHKHSSREVKTQMTETLSRGNNCLLFPEGTTTDGNIKRFHSRLIQSAIDAQAMLQPIAIFYPASNETTNPIQLDKNTLFIGDTSLAESANLILRARHIQAEIHFLEPVSSVGRTRDELAQYSYEKIRLAIEQIRSHH